jgi:hypothetical protein
MGKLQVELGHVRRSLAAVFRPLWQVNDWLGPVSILVSLGISAWVGLVTKSPAWGLVALLGLLLSLTFAEVVRRVRDDRRPMSAAEKAAILDDAIYEGDGLLNLVEQMPFLLDHSVVEGIHANEMWRGRSDLCTDWQRGTEAMVRQVFGDYNALLFDTHPHVVLTRVPPEGLRDFMRPIWESTAYRLAWLMELAQKLGEAELQ